MTTIFYLYKVKEDSLRMEYIYYYFIIRKFYTFLDPYQTRKKISIVKL